MSHEPVSQSRLLRSDSWYGIWTSLTRSSALLLMSLLSGPAAAQSSALIAKVTKPQISALGKAKDDRTDHQKKLSSQLLDALAEESSGLVNASTPKLQASAVLHASNGQVRVIVRTSAEHNDDLVDAILLQGQLLREDPYEVTALMPLVSLTDLAARPEVLTIRLVRDPDLNSDITNNPGQAPDRRVAWEGASSHAVDPGLASEYGATGEGVTVCVISNNVENADGTLLAGSIARGAIDPAKLHILVGQGGPSGTDEDGEGLAMLEIVHAIAPDAELWFATAFGGSNQMAANILALADKGCSIITDDVTYPDESPFQEDVIGRAVEDVSARGILYFSSAGNSGNHYHLTSGIWEGDFSDGGPAGPQFGTGRIHMWKPGITLNTVDQADGEVTIELFWSDPLGKSTNGYDIFAVNANGHVVRKSDTSRTLGADPHQYLEHVRQYNSIVIVKRGDSDPRFLHVSVSGGRLRHNTPGAVRGHNASPAVNAFSVAAKAATPGSLFEGGLQQTVQEFSSDGPRRMFYNADGLALTPGKISGEGGRLILKPDITAADTVSTSIAGDRFNPFRGTSAAAPHAAGIAALLLSCTPRPSPAEIREAFRTTALVLGGAQSDAAGYGVIMARPAIERTCQRLDNPAVAANDIPNRNDMP